MHFKNVVAVTDLSEAGDLCVRAAHTMAGRHGAKIAYLYVVPIFEAASALFPQFHERVVLERTRLMPEAAERLNERVAQITGMKVGDFEAIVEGGATDAVAIEKAEERGFDLVMIPAGRNLERVVRYAHCAVWIVRNEYGSRPVLAATDLSDPSFPAIAAAAEEARLNHQPLTVLFSLDIPPHGGAGSHVLPPYVFTDTELIEMTDHAQARLKDALKEVGTEGESRVPSEPAAPEILRAARDRDCGLIVTGSRGRTGLARLLLGGVAEIVAHDAPCSVLVTRLHTTKQN